MIRLTILSLALMVAIAGYSADARAEHHEKKATHAMEKGKAHHDAAAGEEEEGEGEHHDGKEGDHHDGKKDDHHKDKKHSK